MGTAWARHAMCDLTPILHHSSLTPRSPFHPSEFTAITLYSFGVFYESPFRIFSRQIIFYIRRNI